MKDVKIASSEYNLLDVIKKRWSPRAFSAKEVGKEQILKLLDAARWAASSFNEQPWRFIVGFKNDNTYKKIFDSLGEFNQEWASKAPVLFLALGKKTFSRNGKDNKHHAYDTGQAMATLALQATADGLHIHQMAGFDDIKTKELFNIPEDYQSITACAIGFKGEPELLNESHKKSETAERTRKPLEEIVFGEAFDLKDMQVLRQQ